MNTSNFKTDLPNELLVRLNIKIILFIACFLLMPLIGVSVDIIKASIDSTAKVTIGDIILLVVILSLASYSWLKVFDRNPKIIINRNGIWSKKSGSIPWGDFWYFYIDEGDTSKAGPVYTLIFKSRLNDRDYKIPLFLLDKSFDEIQEAINLNGKGKLFYDLGMNQR